MCTYVFLIIIKMSCASIYLQVIVMVRISGTDSHMTMPI